MEVGKLTVEYRSTKGKNEARRLRARGMVPGICYGPGDAPLPISLDPKALKDALDPEKRKNTVIRMTVGASSGTRELTVMLRDFQSDTLRDEITHVDFLTVDVTKDVTVSIPIILTGKPIGTVDGGQLHAVYRHLPVSCKPENIPVKIEVDVTALDIGDVLHVRDVKMPAGVKAALGEGETIASVVAPKAEKVAEVTEAVEGAAAVPAEGAAAATAAPAAATPAKAEGKGAEAKPAAKVKKQAEPSSYVWLLVGLGNPGPKYRENRHNIGFMVIDELASRHRVTAFRNKRGGDEATGEIGGERVVLLKPMEFMNVSGFAVQRARAFHKIEPDKLVVTHDDVDLALGRLKVKVDGGHGGHNGVRSIIQELGTTGFLRVRCGVGRPDGQGSTADHVLADFQREERDEVRALIKIAADAAEMILQDGPLLTMNRYNVRDRAGEPNDKIDDQKD